MLEAGPGKSKMGAEAEAWRPSALDMKGDQLVRRSVDIFKAMSRKAAFSASPVVAS